ncbi:MAG: diguanylate cyclase [Coriobacteriia bacterium]|nr:diguanylate cyclase [Coriobacteriia bacterium]
MAGATDPRRSDPRAAVRTLISPGHLTRSFFVRVGLVLTVFAGIAFAGLYYRTAALVEERALETARSYVKLIVSTRTWNSEHGGAWVEKRPGVETNRYLLELGVEPDATTTDGRELTLRSPDLMTVEISEIQRRGGGAVFHLTSLRPVDPRNAPDTWERGVLTEFERGTAERWARAESSGVPILRYMQPLITTVNCLRCHRTYAVGEVRGAVSVSVPLADERRELLVNAVGIAGIGLSATALLLISTWLLLNRMRRRLEAAQSALVRAATIDPLTGASTRGHILEGLAAEIERARRTGETIALVMIDIDHFKLVNDAHGHAVGDDVLSEVARRVASTLRPYDELGRLGGEEFLVAAPDTDAEGATALAERIRIAVGDEPVISGGADMTVTVSVGVTTVDAHQPEAIDEALARADGALYESKHSGRDRVSVRCAPTPAPSGANQVS